MSADPSGVIVVGAGHMGERHARAWHDLGVPLRALIDPDRDRAERLAAELGAAAPATLAEALARDDASVVSVCTPTSEHADAAVAALTAGRDVLCEKPVALTLADADRMRDASLRSGRRLRIGFHRRFEWSSRRVLALAPRLGQPTMVQATLTAGVRPKRLMHDADGNGGPVIDMCCHLFDQWMLLFGERPTSVRASGAVLAAGRPELTGIARPAIDSAQIALAYPSGARAQLTVSWGLPPGVPAEERHSYLGPDGLLEVAWPGDVRVVDGEGERRETPPEIDPIPLEIAAFHRELLGGDREVATVDDGQEALRVSLTALRSIDEGGAAVVLERPPAEAAP